MIIKMQELVTEDTEEIELSDIAGGPKSVDQRSSPQNIQEAASMVNEDRDFHLFLFANPKSGSQKAKRFLDPAF